MSETAKKFVSTLVLVMRPRGNNSEQERNWLPNSSPALKAFIFHDWPGKNRQHVGEENHFGSVHLYFDLGTPPESGLGSARKTMPTTCAKLHLWNAFADALCDVPLPRKLCTYTSR